MDHATPLSSTSPSSFSFSSIPRRDHIPEDLHVLWDLGEDVIYGTDPPWDEEAYCLERSAWLRKHPAHVREIDNYVQKVSDRRFLSRPPAVRRSRSL